ncbi:MAG: hypothetical protein HXX10_07310 [Rhodoplanes sp.]|uniref:hypothetical protein n=1 Tax=Rhodoplanes sp. TaxID=1968906 RepID=UPI0017A831CC|nr:hypothetical protein [Rhodoplanes sp.]NVO13827.1 hypothetical protein [Rhodoplanes sp.]
MSRTPAKVTQADVARALRAAMQTGAGSVLVRPDGTIEIMLTAGPAAAPPVDDLGPIVL